VSAPVRSRSGEHEPPFLAAAVQHAPVFLDLGASLARASDLIDEAAAMGARLVVFPESWLPGYPVWIDAGLVWEDPAAKRAFARLRRNAVRIPGPGLETLRRAARRHRVNLVMGATECDTSFSRGTLFNSLIYISDRGELLGVHRKLVPTHSERVVWGRGAGSTLSVFDTSVGRLGGLICWEHWMPLVRFAMHAKGEQVHVASWPDLPEPHHLASRTYAFEGRCYVICAGCFLDLSDVPKDFELSAALRGLAASEGGDSVVLAGGSGIIGPDSHWVAGPVSGREAIVYGAIDLERIAEEQMALDAAGHYNRPDVFELTVDERPREQVVWRRHPRDPQEAG
jgi:nitrilase